MLDKYQFLKGKNGKYENYILGPAWRDHRDSMIVRKMINFAIKQRPKIDTADYFQQKAMNTLIDETHVYDYKEVDFVEKGKEETEQVIPPKNNKPKLQIEDEKENKEIEYEVKVENEVEEKEYEKVEDDIVEEVEDETIEDEEIDVVEVEIKKHWQETTNKRRNH